MCEITVILNRCRTSGLRLTANGNRIGIRPAKRCPPDLLAEIRAQKVALLEVLKAGAERLGSDELPWVHIARQILEGEFNGADRSTLEALRAGVRSIAHPLCRKATSQLDVDLRTGR